jgi:hypothetical protein
MNRREFIAGISATAWPLTARAQPAELVRRIGVLMPFDENEPVAKTLVFCVHASACRLGLDRWPLRADGPSVARRRR